MKGDSGTSFFSASNGRSAWDPLKEPLFSLVVHSQLDLQHRRLDASCRRRGSGRLVSVREGPNVRRSFDGVKSAVRPVLGTSTRGCSARFA